MTVNSNPQKPQAPAATKKVRQLTTAVPFEKASKLEILREWGEYITPRELYLVNASIEWAGTFPDRKPEEGVRLNSAIHPFVVEAIEEQKFAVAVSPMEDENPALADLDNIIVKAATLFESLCAKNAGSCLMVVLPNLEAKTLFAAIDVRRDISKRLLEKKIMMGQYYPTCPFETTFDPASYSLYSPASIVVLRSFTPADYYFIHRIPQWESTYREVFGAPKKKFMTPPPVNSAPQKSEPVESPVHHSVPREIEDAELEVLDDCQSMLAVKDAWNDILNSELCPFQSFDCIYHWYRYACDIENKIRIFILKSEGKAVAILPCYVEGRNIYLAGDDLFHYQDVIAGDQATASELLRRIVAWIPGNLAKHFLNLRNCHSKSYIHNAIEKQDIPVKSSSNSSRFLVNCPFVSVEGGYNKFLSRLTASRRNSIKDAVDRLTGDVRSFTFQVLRAGEITREEFDVMAVFYGANARDKNILSNPGVREFLWAEIDKEDSTFQMAKLFVDGDLIAIDAGFAIQGTYFTFLRSMDSEYSSYDPDKSLMACRIDDLITNDGIHTIDFQPGESHYKQCFTNGQVYGIHSHRVYPTVNRIHLGSTWLANKAKQVVKKSTT